MLLLEALRKKISVSDKNTHADKYNTNYDNNMGY